MKTLTALVVTLWFLTFCIAQYLNVPTLSLLKAMIEFPVMIANSL